MVIITSKYIKPIEVLDALLADHRQFRDVYYKIGKFVYSGPQIPKVGGVIIANVDMNEEVIIS